MKNLKKTNRFIVLICLILSLGINAQQRTKNSISASLGVSIPILTSDGSSDNYASNGSNFYLNYNRELFAKNKSYYTLDLKYLSTSNDYALLNNDVESINFNFPASLGVWTGSSDKFKLSTYMIGFGWNTYLSTNKKFLSSVKIYVGSSTLTCPTQTFTSSEGYFIKFNEIKDNSFSYSTSFGLSYLISKNVSLGVNVEYLKSSFNFNDQEITFSNGGSENQTPYSIDYKNLMLNTELSYRF